MELPLVKKAAKNPTNADSGPRVYRLDLPCEQTGFQTPPFDIHLKVLPSPVLGRGWTLLAHAAAGKPIALARWLAKHPGFASVQVDPGLAPKFLRARISELPASWGLLARSVKVHHLDLGADGRAAWYIEASPDQVRELLETLRPTGPDPPGVNDSIHCRTVRLDTSFAPVSRRQFEALSTAVALGYYEIPHRIDLRTLAATTGVSLGSVSELLRRAEAAILTHYVDAVSMGWPGMEPPDPHTLLPRSPPPLRAPREPLRMSLDDT